jgi:hypothetical protein
LLPVGLNVGGADWPAYWLWLAVIASGLYHGFNPAMGWPLAVAAGLMEKRSLAVFSAFGPLSIGHFVAILVVLLPFALLLAVADWRPAIQLVAALVLVAFGIFRLLSPRHPRALARIPPSRLALWSFAIAIAHGAGLMLVPVYVGLCGTPVSSHLSMALLSASGLGTAMALSLLHVASTLSAGACLAWLVYRYLGLRVVARSWFNLDTSWSVSLILVGAIALALNAWG